MYSNHATLTTTLDGAPRGLATVGEEPTLDYQAGEAPDDTGLGGRPGGAR